MQGATVTHCRWSCSAVRLTTHLLLVMSLIALLAVSEVARAQLSASNAATFVLLRSLDDDEDMRRAFYDSPVNATMTIPVDAYELLSGNRNQVPMLASYTSALFYRGAHHTRPQPYRIRLSDEWVLLEKPLAAQQETVIYTENDVTGQDSDELGNGVVLLHCRMPQARTAAEIEAAENAFLREEGPRMAAALEESWLGLGAPGDTESCLFGDGESGTTGVMRYYVLCPASRISRVRHYELLRRLKAASAEAASEPPSNGNATVSTSAKPEKDKEAVLEFLRARQRARELSDIADDAEYGTAFELIGQHHDVLSRPQWNAAQGAWEILYPSTSPCSTHMAPPSEDTLRENGRERTPRGRSAPTSVTRADPFWKTLVRFRCDDAGVEKEDTFTSGSFWAITQMRQACTFQVEISTNAVCGWEQELDRLRVNAIPCVVLSPEGLP